MRSIILLVFVISCLPVAAQVARHTYHDADKKYIKERYQVKDTISNILHGKYISYYLNGNVESRGQFTDNETVGVWEFFYETGNLKMRGILKQNSNYGFWEYFYESGKKSMEGTINGRIREGEWKTFYENGQVKEVGEYANNKRTGLWLNYFEDGVKKGEITYNDDYGRFTEYYHSGKVLAEGPKMGTKQVGHWRYFSESGVIQSEGNFENNKRHGLWTMYHENGNVAAKGSYEYGEPSGDWEYFFDTGTKRASGSFEDGQKHGVWVSFSLEGVKLSEGNYNKGTGEYREYYPDGKLKLKGMVINEKREGKWEYYATDGKREGECEYKNGKGIYKGFYPDGSLRTKGEVEDDQKTGTWEMYDRDGTLKGYYKPIYEDKKMAKEISDLVITRERLSSKIQRGFGYFDERSNEFKGLIVAGNPVMTFVGRFPMGVEFYAERRLGHEFEFIGIRDPFFQADEHIATGKLFERGYAIAVKQKLYNPIKVGMWYFGHEIRFTNIGHFTNIILPSNPGNTVTISASEQRIQYGFLLGYRLMQRTDKSGFTMDIFGSLDVGYRGVDVEKNFEVYFENVSQSVFITTFHVGLNLGNVFSAR